ncbi:hypothetical protein AcW1_002967 [Taiwanofungus camphoratus]|nr:hypothetical protein AcV5_001847 [Antrodia cinnamomea]KAI0942303.1 hypothetical protein AcW1_002967 [Antrodia cinnamomea]
MNSLNALRAFSPSLRRLPCLSHTSRSVRIYKTLPNPVRYLSTNNPRFAPRYARFNVDPEHPLDIKKWDIGMRIFVAVLVGGGVYYVTNLEKVPETGRWRFMDINPKFEAQLAKAAHDDLMAEFKGKLLPPNHPITRHVRRVVTQILESSDLGTLSPPEPGFVALPSAGDDLWMPQTPRSEDFPPGTGGKQWNLMVVNDDRVVNAMASYGNIIVFTGILPVAKDEQGLAAVLGHEIGHVVARHNSERYSSAKVLIFLVYALQVLGLDMGLSRIVSALLYDLPNSRAQELEADQIGLQLAARACFDPRAALEMFSRLGKLEKAHSRLNIDFLGTHPASDRRIQRLEQLLPDAYAIQAASPECAGNIHDSLAAFRDTFTHGPWRGGNEGNATWA